MENPLAPECSIFNFRLCLPLLLVLIFSCSSKEVNLPQDDDNLIQNTDTLDNRLILSFGSCNKQNDDQSYWNVISQDHPDLWIWMGDIIYADTENMTVMKSKYDQQKSNTHYSQFIAEVPVIGTWDDHDYGVNDGNRNYAKKEESKSLLLEFLEVDTSNQVYKRSGVYQSYEIGEGDYKVKCILLDTRSFQEPLTRNPSGNPRYLPSDGDILGEEQWLWLEEELNQGDQIVNVIVSSIQLLADEQIYEKWGNFPKEKERLFNLLRENQSRPSIVLSGDRHLAEISKTAVDGLGFPLYDITSSGMTHSYESANESNSLRQGDLVTVKNYGILEFSGEGSDMVLNAKIKDMSGQVLIQHTLDIFN